MEGDEIDLLGDDARSESPYGFDLCQLRLKGLKVDSHPGSAWDCCPEEVVSAEAIDGPAKIKRRRGNACVAEDECHIPMIPVNIAER